MKLMRYRVVNKTYCETIMSYGIMALPVNIEDLEEYIRQGELDKKEKAYI